MTDPQSRQTVQDDLAQKEWIQNVQPVGPGLAVFVDYPPGDCFTTLFENRGWYVAMHMNRQNIYVLMPAVEGWD
jgi:hypothetical protein